MRQARFPAKEFEAIKGRMVYYNSALKTMQTRLEILREGYQTLESYNPIEHIAARIKSFDSMANKLRNKKLPLTLESLTENLNDIAGVRIICSFTKDIESIVAALKMQEDLNFLREMDYIREPKPSGYRSYHLILTVPVYLTDHVEHVKTEIQIRTQAMDFWASLEHKVRYKYEGEVPEHLANELRMCADKIDELDNRMYLIHDIINLINA